MTYDTDMDIIALSPFEPNAMFATTEDSDTIRRFTTLLDCGAVGGGSHHLRKVANTEGETFALKTLLPLSGCDENGSAISPSGIKTLTEEYRNLAAVSLLGGFPKTYGYGYTGSVPAILMEWIEGLPLRDAAAELTDPAEGDHIPANTVAAIGKRLGEILWVPKSSMRRLRTVISPCATSLFARRAGPLPSRLHTAVLTFA